ncbi:hypothetical protein FNU76_23490 [Chitinimonas arctica]|uniref:Uncharacterized protein n=1 Tax=Chitinimonas arctica TaxID=2594795 RepID=A0A516SLN6_9NEIS|nr:hypothetical protein [Chitinimonas arctica]QDQ29074.1 hypothetical protein FNU76_23490 [Chitinimonas arctica]
MRVIIYDEAVATETLAEALREDAVIVLELARPIAREIQHKTSELFDEGEVPVQLEALFGHDIDTTFGWLHYMVNPEMFQLYTDEGVCTLIMKALERRRRQGSRLPVFATSVF